MSQHPVHRVFVAGPKAQPPCPTQPLNPVRLEIPLEGCYETQIAINQRPVTVALTPGSALVLPPNGWSLPTWQQPARLLSIQFSHQRIDLCLIAGQSPDQPGQTLQQSSYPSPLTGPLPKVLDALREVHASGGPSAALPDLVRALLCCLQQVVLQPLPQTETPAKTLLQEVCAYVQEHFAQDLSRESVARHFGISPSYLSRVFQVQGRLTFSSYLARVRTDRAKHLLRQYPLKLDEVAARCGFHDTAYFCRVFKRLSQLTPAQYRAQYKTGLTAKELVLTQ